MPHDTQALNKQQNLFGDQQELWLFGYGSLIFKVDFPYLERRPAVIQGWVRRFWQGSHDHRGTPKRPGRVLTLIEAPGEDCLGMAYRVTPDVFDHLDHREKNGYLRFTTDMAFLTDQPDGKTETGTNESAKGLVYIATQDNEAYLGPAPTEQLAQHIFQSRGPSGENREYVLELAKALRQLNAEDSHVFDLEQALLKLQASESV